MTPPETDATVAAQSSGAVFTAVQTRPASSAVESAELQGLEPGQLLRTIVVRVSGGDYVFVLVPADREIAWPKLRRLLGVKRLSLPPGDEAEAATGYRPGTITPFGSATRWPVIIDKAAMTWTTISVGGGRPGVNIQMTPQELQRVLEARAEDVTTRRETT